MTFHAPQTFYSNQHGRFDGSAVGLSDEQLYKIAPSVFALEAHESRSDKFVPVPTIDILNQLRKEGFECVGAKQSVSRDPGKQAFTKHLLRLRRVNDGKEYQVGDSVFEILLRNANDGTAAYDLLGGLFRIVCKNSLVRQTSTVDAVKVRHNGKHVINDVIEGTYRVLDQAEAALVAPQDWSQITLNRDDQIDLATAAHHVRFADAEGNVNTPIRPEQLLLPRRFEDRKDDLWTTFNRTQEACIKGGVTGYNAATHRRQTTREVKGIDQDLKINKALWIIGEHFAKAKKAAA